MCIWVFIEAAVSTVRITESGVLAWKLPYQPFFVKRSIKRWLVGATAPTILTDKGPLRFVFFRSVGKSRMIRDAGARGPRWWVDRLALGFRAG